MMNPLFEDPEKQELLRSALDGWRGTPFRSGLCQRGIGADCYHVIIGIYEDCGYDLAEAKTTRGSLHHGKFHASSPILDWLGSDEIAKQHIRVVDDTPPLPGDIIVLRQGRSAHHVGIHGFQDDLWHLPRGGTFHPVSFLSISPWYHSSFRVMI